MNIETIKKEIVDRLKPVKPHKIILFGSYAYGKPNEESDIDIYVVTNDDFIPKNYDEKMNVYLNVARRIRDIRKYIYIDLIVHTKKMYENFRKTKSNFLKQSLNKVKYSMNSKFGYNQILCDDIDQ